MPPPPPELPDDLLGDIFLRLPSDDPACLLRASLVCKRWRRVLADPAFRRRHRELNRAPAIVGFLRIVNGVEPFCSRFVPNNPASGLPAARDLRGWLVLDCRHDRALFLTTSPGAGAEPQYDFVVWNPLTNEQHRLPRPSPPPTMNNGGCFNAAVVCAAATEGCDHRSCHGGPFCVAFVWSHSTGLFRPYVTSARVYSSEMGDWSEPTSVQHRELHIGMPWPSALVGDTLYFWCSWNYAFGYQLGARHLSIIDQRPPSLSRTFGKLVSMEEGRLGCVDIEEEPSLCLRLWSREATPNGDRVARWTRGRAIDLEALLPDGALPARPFQSVPICSMPGVLGFAEGTGFIFVGTRTRDKLDAVYMLQLNSDSGREKATKVLDGCTLVVPYTSFCIPVIDGASTSEGATEGASSA